MIPRLLSLEPGQLPIDPAGSGPRGWDGKDISPTLFTRTQGCYLQFQSAASLYLSGASPWFPAAASPPLTSCQWPSVTGIRTLNSACACVSVRPHPRACAWRGARDLRGAMRGSHPRTLILLPTSLPSVLSLLWGVASRYLKAREGANGDPGQESPVKRARQSQCPFLIHSWLPLA